MKFAVKNLRYYLPFAAGLLAVLPFLGALRFGFLYEWDDGGFILENPHLVWNIENLQYLLTHTLQGVYTPLLSFLVMAEYAVFGADPAAFHFISLVLFGGGAFFFYRILNRDFRVPAIAALFFTVFWSWNPARVESVAWISEQKGVASILFALAAFHYTFRGRHGTGSLLTAAAILFKPWVLPLPGILFLQAYWRKKGNLSEALRDCRGELTAGALAAMAVVFFSFRDLAVQPGAVSSPLVWGGNILRYLGAAFFPLFLNPIHPNGCNPVEYLWGAGILGLLLYVFHRGGIPLKLRWILLLALALAILPVLNAGKYTNADYADRYSMPISTVFWAVAALTLRKNLQEIQPRRILTGMIFAGMLGWSAWSYLPVFSNTGRLFPEAISRAISAGFSPAPKAMEAVALVGLNRNSPTDLQTAAALFRLHARKTGDARMFSAFHDTADLLEMLAPAMVHSTARKKLGARLLTLECYKGYSGDLFFDRAFTLAVEESLSSGDVPGALRLMDKRKSFPEGSAFSRHFHAGLAAFLRKNYSAAANEWKKAEQLHPNDENIRGNRKLAEEKNGSL